jgi:hypothetical protein
VDTASEQVLQRVLQRSLLQQARPVAHVHEHVEIAAWSRIAANNRPKHAYGRGTLTVLDLDDLDAAPAQFGKARRWPGRAGVRIIAHRHGRLDVVGLS